MKDTAQDEKLSHPILKWANQTHNVELTLYGSITLVAVIIAVRIERNAETPLGLMVAIWATALGLSIAHVFAVAMSRRIASPIPIPLMTYIRTFNRSLPLLIAGIVATAGALIGTAITPTVTLAARGADFALSALCFSVAWLGATAHGLPTRRKLVFASIIVIVLAVVTQIKVLIGI